MIVASSPESVLIAGGGEADEVFDEETRQTRLDDGRIVVVQRVEVAYNFFHFFFVSRSSCRARYLFRRRLTFFLFNVSKK